MDEPLDAIFLRLLEEDARTDDIGGVDILRRIEREGGCGVDDDIGASHTFTNRIPVTDIPLQESDLIALGVGEIDEVYTGNIVIPVRNEIADEIDAQKPTDACDVNLNENLQNLDK